MRLLHVEDDGQLRLTEFSSDPPPYGILSHTWGADDEEVTFQEMSQGVDTSKAGYEKIRRCAEQVVQHGLSYFWVDSCCIDKSSSAELSEAINSMFKYYEDAVICFVFLMDLNSKAWNQEILKGCRWFTRGWTLQELLAPKKALFFGSDWELIGDKISLAEVIKAATGISKWVIAGKQDIAELSVGTKMSWAASRQTKRQEDMAYCLLGIFEVNMPLLYGEGSRAFRRLQEEIVKRTNDMTIFAWIYPDNRDNDYNGLFASGPASFYPGLEMHTLYKDNPSYSVTNKGLRLSRDVPLHAVTLSERPNASSTEVNICEEFYVLPLGKVFRDGLTSTDEGIFLRKIGPGLFCRMKELSLLSEYKHKIRGMFFFTELYIIIDPKLYIWDTLATYRRYGVHVHRNHHKELREVFPHNLWDVQNQMFLHPKTPDWTRSSTVLMMRFRCEINLKPEVAHIPLMVLCDYRQNTPKLIVLHEELNPREAAIILQPRHQEYSLSWEELGFLAPKVLELNDTVQFNHTRLIKISVSLKEMLLDNEFAVQGLELSKWTVQ